MQARACVLALFVVLAGGATSGADVHATLGDNELAMPESETTYRLMLAGGATRVDPRPATADPAAPSLRSSTGLVAAMRRVDRIERLVVLDPATGARRVAV